MAKQNKTSKKGVPSKTSVSKSKPPLAADSNLPLNIPPELLAELPPEDVAELQRAAQEMAARMMGKRVPRRDGNRAAERAEELMERARRAPPGKAIALARQALDLWPDCCDAYILLGDCADELDEAIDLYEQAVAAGRRALGDKFEEYVGHFWGFWDTRPYMTARFQLADTLLAAGRREEAIGHYEEMLRLNPNDNQGVRDTLLACYLELGRHQQAGELIERYRESGMATWSYGKTLLKFQVEGDSAAAKVLLTSARKANKHVPAYLLGDKPMPSEMPEYYSPGESSEAVMIAALFLPAWKSTPGAISWLRSQTTAPKGKKSKQAAVAPQLHIPVEDLRNTPLEPGEVWQVDTRRFPGWVKEGRQTVRPWIVFVIDADNHLIVHHDMDLEQPTPESLRHAVASAIVAPMTGPPRRPEAIEVCSLEVRSALQPQLDEAGVRCAVRDDLPGIDHALDSFSAYSAGDEDGMQVPAIIDSPGIEPSQFASFFDAAAAFYRLTPWRQIPGDTVLEVKCTALAPRPWYGVVMGQLGVQLGLALYDNEKCLKAILRGDASDKKNANQTSGLSLMYGEDRELPVRDLDAIERHGWSVAGPEAYPLVLRIKPRMQLEQPKPAELELLEACLRALPTFLDRPDQGSIEVTTAAGPRTVQLRKVPAK